MVTASYTKYGPSWLRVYKLSELIRAESDHSFDKNDADLALTMEHIPDTLPPRVEMCSGQVRALCKEIAYATLTRGVVRRVARIDAPKPCTRFRFRTNGCTTSRLRGEGVGETWREKRDDDP